MKASRLDVLTPQQVDRMIVTRIEQGIAVRAEAIGRTEALRVVSEARYMALWQSAAPAEPAQG